MDTFGEERTFWLNTERPVENFDYHLWTPKEPWGIANVQGVPIAELMAKFIRPVAEQAQRGNWLYDLVVLDSISVAEHDNVSYIEANTGKKDGRQIWGDQFADMFILLRTLQAGTRQKNTVGKYVGVGANVIITARARQEMIPNVTNPDGTPKFFSKPDLRGYWGDHIAHPFNIVAYLEYKGASRKIHLVQTARYVAKCDWEKDLKGNDVDAGEWDEGFRAFPQVLEACGIEKEVLSLK